MAVTGSTLLMRIHNFGVDSILTALLSINGYLFFLHLTRGLGDKAIREQYRYDVTEWAPKGHCADSQQPHTVAVALCLCGAERNEAKTESSISTHAG